VHAASRAVLVATVHAGCGACDGSVEGREAIMLRLTVNGRYAQHLPIVRRGTHAHVVLLGTVPAGSHRVRAEVDRQHSARELPAAAGETIRLLTVEAVPVGDSRYEALAHAPFVYQRPNTVGGFSDLPLLMWYEVEPTARGVRYRYSVVFSNEDGGTPADRLMATWGRTTDIEYVYSVELDARGRILHQDYQGPGHEVLPYRGTLEGRHAKLWVVTDNNMVRDRGTTSVRFSPAPILFPLRDVSREAVMDAHPWLYAVAAEELVRERKIVADAPPGQGRIPDPRRYVYLEGCGTIGASALTFAVHVRDEWYSSDRGVPEYRIVRDGCFRAAVPLPDDAGIDEVRAVRVHAFTRPGKPGGEAVRFTALNRMFALDDTFAPRPSRLEWRGDATITPDGAPLQILVK
jgi:hypothetical protein